MNLDVKLFPEMLANLAKEYPDRPAVTCRDKTITYGQLKLAVDHCAVKLAGAGLQKGDKAVLWGVNGIEWVVAFYGIIQAGGVAALMNYGLKASDVSTLSKMVDASWGIIGGNTISNGSTTTAGGTTSGITILLIRAGYGPDQEGL